jgi:membrane glycosyltransferase
MAGVAGLGTLALALQIDAMPTDAGTAWWAQAVLATLLLAWLGSGVVTALMGAWVMHRGDAHALRVPESGRIDHKARTAIVMPICHEDVATVFGGLSATAESLAATGALRLFDIFVLSDSADPTVRAAEQRAWQALREQLGDGEGERQRVFYRWRRRRTKRKAGNLADFCRRWGRRYRYMIVLDADSTMHGDTLVALVRTMEAHPRAGIVQTLPAPTGLSTIHARMQQFASRVIGRLFALGMAYWQLGESHFWGHNAIIRIEPFMRYCGLGAIPGRGGLAGEILSHDFVEAAMMRRAGYEVWLAPTLGGSWEQHPANLIEELQRDRRWCQGNLQNARLIAEPGWCAAHRVMFGVGALSYGVAPLWLAYVALSLLGGATLGGGWLAMAMLVGGLLLLPRVLGVAAVLLRGEQALYGGPWRLSASAMLELLLSSLQAPLKMLAHTAFVLGALTGLRLEWTSPARDDGTLAWRDAQRGLGWLTLPTFVVTLLVLLRQHRSPLPLAPWLVPLVLAVPLTVLASHRTIGRRLQRAGLLAVPEERHAPRTLVRAAEHHGFARVRPPPAPAPLRMPLRRSRPAIVFAACTMVLAMLVPHVAVAPGAAPNDAIASHEEAADVLAEGEAGAAISVAAARPMRTLRARPARRIDDAVRQRAYEAVRRAMEAEAYMVDESV